MNFINFPPFYSLPVVSSSVTPFSVSTPLFLWFPQLIILYFSSFCYYYLLISLTTTTSTPTTVSPLHAHQHHATIAPPPSTMPLTYTHPHTDPGPALWVSGGEKFPDKAARSGHTWGPAADQWGGGAGRGRTGPSGSGISGWVEWIVTISFFSGNSSLGEESSLIPPFVALVLQVQLGK